jgi:hypothetical protein
LYVESYCVFASVVCFWGTGIDIMTENTRSWCHRLRSTLVRNVIAALPFIYWSFISLRVLFVSFLPFIFFLFLTPWFPFFFHNFFPPSFKVFSFYLSQYAFSVPGTLKDLFIER